MKRRFMAPNAQNENQYRNKASELSEAGGKVPDLNVRRGERNKGRTADA